MSAEKLTQKVLEQHDKLYSKLQATKEMTLQRKESLNPNKIQMQLTGRRESTRPGHLVPSDQTSSYLERKSSKSIERKSSKSFLSAQQKSGLSVFRVVQAARAWQRFSQKQQKVQDKPKVSLENTYKVGPDAGMIFKAGEVEVIIKDIVTRYLRNFKYTAEGAKQMCLRISSEIKLAVKRLELPRYKFVCNVIIMQNKGQGSQVSSRCVWDQDTDSFATYTFKVGQVICVATIHAVYFE